MDDSYALKCLSCKASLQVPKETEYVVCEYCGTAHVIRKSGGTVSLSLARALENVQAGVDRTASELAIRRLREELKSLNDKKAALNSQYEKEVQQINAQLAPMKAKIQQHIGKKQGEVGQLSLIFTLAVVLAILSAVVSVMIGYGDTPLTQVHDPSWLNKWGLSVPAWGISLALLTGAFLRYTIISVTSDRAIRALEQQISRIQSKVDRQLVQAKAHMEEKLQVINREISNKQQQLNRHLEIVSH